MDELFEKLGITPKDIELYHTAFSLTTAFPRTIGLSLAIRDGLGYDKNRND